MYTVLRRAKLRYLSGRFQPWTRYVTWSYWVFLRRQVFLSYLVPRGVGISGKSIKLRCRQS